MAPIQPLDNFTPRMQERAHLYTKEDRENAGWIVLGLLCGAAFFVIVYIMIKKYREKWGDQITSLKDNWSNWKASNTSKEPKVPEPAHVANTHITVFETPSVDKITENLTPAYMKRTTATLHG